MKKSWLIPLLLSGFALQAQDTIFLDSTRLVPRVLVEQMTIPWDLVWGTDGWIWFNERDGDIYRLHPDTKEMQLIHSIPDVFESWDNSGCHAMALDPDFPLSPYLYVHYTYAEFASKLVRYTYSAQSNSLSNPIILLDGIGGNSSHNGSRIQFDEDGYLLLAMGDAFVAHVAQDLESVNGKILRMTKLGEVPPGNPFPNSLVWSYGHRNPQGLVLAPNGILYSSEHGEANDDEVNLIERGRNYGWPEVEGFCDQLSEQGACDSLDVVEPLAAWSPTYAPCGLAYFDHPSIPEWRHCLIQTFLKRRRLTVLPLTEDGTAIVDDQKWDYLVERFGRLRDVLVTPNGRLFICTSNEETNGQWVPKDNYDKIIELVNPDYEYPSYVFDLDIQTSGAFPNPASDVLWINLPVNEPEIWFRVTNDQGRVVLEESFETWYEGLWRIDLPSGLTPGVYNVTYITSAASGNMKVVLVNDF